MAISFRAEIGHQVNKSPDTMSEVKASSSKVVLEDSPEDIVDIKSDFENPEKNEKTDKKSVWQSFKDGYTNFKKGLITAGQYVVGTVKGLIYGSAAAFAVIGVDTVRGIVKKSPKYLSTKGKVLAAVVGTAVHGAKLFNANLKTNSKKAYLDHRWKTGHNK